jgi:isoleucyl-tRNA synthetase
LPNLLVITRNAKDKAAIDRGQGIIRDELNVKAIEFSAEEAKFVRLGVKPNLKTLGKKLGSSLGQVRSAFETLSADPAAVAEFLSQAETLGRVTVAGHELTVEDLLIERGPKDDRLIATESGVTVLLDTKVSLELLHEGYAREVVSRVQNLRKESGLNVTDRIKISVACDDELRLAIATHTEYINNETLGTALEFVRGIDMKHQVLSDVDGKKLHLGLAKV